MPPRLAQAGAGFGMVLQPKTPSGSNGRCPFNTFCKKPYTGFLLYDNAIYSNIRV